MKGTVIPAIIIVFLVAILSMEILLIPSEGPKVNPDQLRELAAVLEQQALYEAAIKAYEAYLDAADIPSELRANILYRVGQIYDERLADYENALAIFIRIRELYPQTTICKDARKRIVECLEALNRSGDAQRQMRAVAELGGEKEKETATGPVVAKIGERAITMGELDREIEKLPKQMQAQFHDPAKKDQFLKQYVFTELLYDLGKRKGYEKDKEIRRQVRDFEKQAIVGKVYKAEISDAVTLDDSDYDLYYQAHKDEFIDPERIALAHIELASKEEAIRVLKRIQNGEEFADLAKELSTDPATQGKGGELGELRAGSTYVPGLGNEPAIAKAAEALKVGSVTGPIESSKGWHILTVTGRTPPHQKTLDEVKSQIGYALRRLKEKEKRNELLKRMLDAEKIKIYEDRFPTPVPTAAS